MLQLFSTSDKRTPHRKGQYCPLNRGSTVVDGDPASIPSPDTVLTLCVLIPGLPLSGQVAVRHSRCVLLHNFHDLSNITHGRPSHI